MDDVFCDITAFHLYRTPPAVLALFDELPIARDVATRRSLAKMPFVEYVLGLPLHVLVNKRSERYPTKNFKRHLWTGEFSYGAIQEVEGLGYFTSPEMTLLLMARWMKTVRLALAMYEFCGSFTIFEMPPELSAKIEQNGTKRFNLAAGWRQVKDYKGNPTSLWSRPPLTTIDRLQVFADANCSVYGINNFTAALSLVAGMTRSPIEAEAALLLSTSRRLGGFGFKLETNRRIPLTRNARKIYPHDYCEADIYIESPSRQKVVDLECQGASIHTGELATVTDANRTTALESMGINVVQITYADIQSPERLDLISKHVDAKLGVSRQPRTDAMRKAERRLRAKLPVSWGNLADKK